MNALKSTAMRLYSGSSQPGGVTHICSIMGRAYGGDQSLEGEDDAFDLTGDLGTWLSIILATLVGPAVAYTLALNYQKSGKPHAGTRSLRDGSSVPRPLSQESDIELRSATPGPLTRKSQVQALPQEPRVAVPGRHVLRTPEYMSSAPLMVGQRDGEEPKSPTFPPEAKLKGQMSEEKVLGTWTNLRRTCL